MNQKKLRKLFLMSLKKKGCSMIEIKKQQIELSKVLISLANMIKASSDDKNIQKSALYQFEVVFKVEGDVVNFYKNNLTRFEQEPINNTKN